MGNDRQQVVSNILALNGPASSWTVGGRRQVQLGLRLGHAKLVVRKQAANLRWTRAKAPSAAAHRFGIRTTSLVQPDEAIMCVNLIKLAVHPMFKTLWSDLDLDISELSRKITKTLSI